jgi:predicted nucleic acid-binding protein
MNLLALGQLSLLEQLYGRVLIPELVLQELSVIASAQSEFQAIQTSSWIETRPVVDAHLTQSLLLELDAGEAEAIVLALETKADLLLIDERRGRRVASRMGLKVIGLLGIVVEAKQKGLITAVKPLLDELMLKAGFWVSRELYSYVLMSAGEKGP